MDCAYEDISDIMYAVYHSLKIVFPSEVALIIHGQCTDSGGEGTNVVFIQVINSKHIAHECYLVVACLLHNLMIGLQNAVKTVPGVRGADEKEDFVMNAM